jgi:NADPH2 dehydrogenase
VVGAIIDPRQADAILADTSADQIAMARAFLDNPHWAWHAAKTLGADVAVPNQYMRAGPKMWKPALSTR